MKIVLKYGSERDIYVPPLRDKLCQGVIWCSDSESAQGEISKTEKQKSPFCLIFRSEVVDLISLYLWW